MPVYNRFTTVNYYDLLYSLIINRYMRKSQKETKARKERIERIKERGDKLTNMDAIELNSKEFWNLELLEQETFLELTDPQFQNVINRMEHKGMNAKVRI